LNKGVCLSILGRTLDKHLLQNEQQEGKIKGWMDGNDFKRTFVSQDGRPAECAGPVSVPSARLMQGIAYLWRSNTVFGNLAARVARQIPDRFADTGVLPSEFCLQKSGVSVGFHCPDTHQEDFVNYSGPLSLGCAATNDIL